MKYLLIIFFLKIILLPAGAMASCEEGELLIKFSHVSKDSHPKGLVATAIANRINKEMNGKACMQVFSKSTLFNDNKVFEGLLLGDVQFAAPSLSKFEAYTKKFRIFDLPFLFKDADSIKRFLSGGKGKLLLSEIEDKGISGIGFVDGGFKQFSANKPLYLPSDAKRLTFRANSSDVTVSMFESLGSKGVKIPFKEAYAAMQSGVVDGQENSWSNILNSKFYEVQDGITETNHRTLTYMVISSTAWMRSLSPDMRSQILMIMNEEIDAANERFALKDQQAKSELMSLGVPIRSLSDEQRKEWEHTMNKVWDKYSRVIGQELISEAIKSNSVN
ncbi:MAG: DctP family TRAP transporter solute-binding subunit [Cellvibrionaceae bacterium]